MYRTATADDVGIMDSSNEDEDDDSVDPQHVDDSNTPYTLDFINHLQ